MSILRSLTCIFPVSLYHHFPIVIVKRHLYNRIVFLELVPVGAKQPGPGVSNHQELEVIL